VAGLGELAVRVSGLRKAYGRVVAADGVDLEVRRSEILGLIGPNGSGKTTTVECVQGLRTPDAGSVEVLGCDPIRDRSRLRTRIGCQLQDAALPDRLKVWEALDLFASLVPGALHWEHLVDDWGLAAKRGAAFGELSGGQRQRLFIALALVNEPELVFLDEMTTGLDPSARRVAWELIERVRERGVTVVLVTHFMDEAEHLCDRVAVMRAGRVVACDSPARLIASHAPGSTVTFTGPAASPDGADDLGWLDGVAGVESVTRRGQRIEVSGSGPLLVRTAAALAGRGLEPEDLDVKRRTLEDVYLALAGEGALSAGAGPVAGTGPEVG
jgi:ABC-2 type transport system ATP-binding protein